MKRFWFVIDCFAAFLAFEIVLYLFTGLHFWAPLSRNEAGYSTDMAREMGLMLLHIVVPAVAILRRWAP